ncbi:MAG: hypothetical protein ACW99A_12455 [Candidatus Kariarchaeaceae archaeon]
MGKNFDILELLRIQKENFAEAFPMVNYYEEDWGYHFEWNNFGYHLTDFIFIQSDPGANIDSIRKIIKSNKTKKIYLLQGLNLNINELTKNYEIGLYYRKWKKISSPILTETGVKSFSYRSGDSEFNLKNHINEMAEIEEIDDKDKLEFNRLVGGHMHLFAGEIWSIDSDGAILSNTLLSKLENHKNIIMIDIFSTRSKIRRMGHGKALLQSILASHKNNDFVVLVKKTPESSKLLEYFDFRLEVSMDVYF